MLKNAILGSMSVSFLICTMHNCTCLIYLKQCSGSRVGTGFWSYLLKKVNQLKIFKQSLNKF
jgi:hypothetical protein